jgi:hypothetical protein
MSSADKENAREKGGKGKRYVESWRNVHFMNFHVLHTANFIKKLEDISVCDDDRLLQLLCFWTIFLVLILFKQGNVFCLK